MASSTRKRRRETPGPDEPRVIRKYSNRRLYDTTTGTFVTLEDLRRMVVEGEAFVVQDAKEGKDITPSILAQIIAEQHGRGESVLPGDLMRQLIAFYDNGMSEGFFEYLKASMDSFSKNWPGMEPYNEMSRRNMELFRKSYESFFSAFDPARTSTPDGAATPHAEPSPEPPPEGEEGDLEEEVSDLQRKFDDMQKEIERLSKAKDGEAREKGED
jgi:polyhydroxyalkanoate synthesis repressor PhaR